jgi:hypothetical protein
MTTGLRFAAFGTLLGALAACSSSPPVVERVVAAPAPVAVVAPQPVTVVPAAPVMTVPPQTAVVVPSATVAPTTVYSAPASAGAPAAAQPPAGREGETVRIDASTPADARRALTAAGYSDIRGLRKGLDNFWHAQAVRDGVAVRVVVTPERRIIEEGE